MEKLQAMIYHRSVKLAARGLVASRTGHAHPDLAKGRGKCHNISHDDNEFDTPDMLGHSLHVCLN